VGLGRSARVESLDANRRLRLGAGTHPAEPLGYNEDAQSLS
jgi:hypothetical protein